jgi:hypothetical protein
MGAVSDKSINYNVNSRFKGGLNGDRPIMISELLEVLAALGFTGGGGSSVVQTILSGDTTHSPSSDVLFTALAGKVSNQAGLGLSQNSYTNAEKAKLASIDVASGSIVIKDPNSGLTYLLSIYNTGFVTGVPYP